MTSKQVVLVDCIFGETIEGLGISYRLLVPLVSGRSLFNAISYYLHYSFAYVSVFDKLPTNYRKFRPPQITSLKLSKHFRPLQNTTQGYISLYHIILEKVALSGSIRGSRSICLPASIFVGRENEGAIS